MLPLCVVDQGFPARATLSWDATRQPGRANDPVGMLTISRRSRRTRLTCGSSTWRRGPRSARGRRSTRVAAGAATSLPCPGSPPPASPPSPARYRSGVPSRINLADAPLSLVGQVGASSGRALATWARSAASSGGGALLDQRCQYTCSRAHGHSQLRTRRSVAVQTARSPPSADVVAHCFPSRRLWGGGEGDSDRGRAGRGRAGLR